MSSPVVATVNGVTGFTVTVTVNIAQTSTTDNDSLKGPLTWTDDLSGMPAGTVLQACTISQNGVPANVASCTQSAPGANFTVSLPVTGAPQGGSYVLNGKITLFVPGSSVSAAGETDVNKFTNFAPVSPTGVANVPPAGASQPCGADAASNQNPQCAYVTFPQAAGTPPQYTLSKTMSAPVAATVDGVAGYTVNVYPNVFASTQLPALQGPLTWTDVLSGMPPGTRLTTCALQQYARPTTPAGTCSQVSPGGNISISVPVTGSPVVNQGKYYYVYGDNTTANSYFTLFFPSTSLPTAPNSIARNQFTNFAPKSPTGATNQPPATMSQPCGADAASNQNPQCAYVTLPAPPANAVPKFTLSKGMTGPTATTYNGVAGYNVTILPRINSADPNPALQGPLTFTDDLSGFPASTVLRSCQVWQWPNGGAADPSTHGTCTQSGPGANINVSVPITGGPQPFGGRYWYVFGDPAAIHSNITVFIPHSAIPAGGLDLVNRFTNFAPSSPTGVANQPPPETTQPCGEFAATNTNPMCAYLHINDPNPNVAQYTLTKVMSGFPLPATVDGVAGYTVDIFPRITAPTPTPLQGPLTWTDDLSGFPAGTRMIACQVWQFLPGAAIPDPANRGTCVQSAPGANIDISVPITGPPAAQGNGFTYVFGDGNNQFNSYIRLFIPGSSVPASGLNAVNEFTDFAPVAVDGSPNHPPAGASEPCGTTAANNPNPQCAYVSGALSGGTDPNPSATPQYQLTKRMDAPVAATVDGVSGFLVKIYPQISSATPSPWLQGPLTWTDDLSGMPAGATVQTCHVWQWPNGGLASPETMGTCTQPAPGANITFSVPISGGPQLFNGRYWYVIGDGNNQFNPYVELFVPATSIPAGGMDAVNKYTDFAPVSQAGQANQPPPASLLPCGTDAAGNQNPQCAYARFPQPSDTAPTPTMYKVIEQPDASNVTCSPRVIITNTSRPPAECIPSNLPLNGAWSQVDKTAYAGQTATAAIGAFLGAGVYNNYVMCDRFSPATEPLDTSRPVTVMGPAGFRIQYTNGSVGSTEASLKSSGCGLGADNVTDGPWFDSVAAAGGAQNITGVRVVWDSIPSTPVDLALFVPFRYSLTATTGTDYFAQSWDGAPKTAADPDGSNVSNPVNSGGAASPIQRQNIRPLAISTRKTADVLTVAPGVPVEFTIEPSEIVGAGNTAGRTVTVVDQLPSCVENLSVPAEVAANWSYTVSGTAGACPGGFGQTITFTLKTPVVPVQNSPADGLASPNFPTITYSVQAKATTPNGTVLTNTANTVDDATQQSATSTAAITVNAPAAVVTSKSALNPTIEPGGAASWSFEARNNTTTNGGVTSLIDVFPFNGDTAGSVVHGSLTLTGATPTVTSTAVPPPATLPTVTLFYTSRTPSQVSNNASDPSNQPGGSTIWCTEAQFGTAGCPASLAAATAVKAVVSDFAPQTNVKVTLQFSTSGNQAGDQYLNVLGAGQSATPLTIPATSPAAVSVVAATLSGTVWQDPNRSGVIESGETGLANVTVRLLDANGNTVATTTTDANGNYTFANLVAGNYSVAVDRATVPANLFNTYSKGGGTTAPADDSGTIAVAAGASVQQINFGYAPVRAELRLVKSSNITSYGAAGTQITYTFAVTNTGNVPVAGLQIADTQALPAGALTYGPACPTTPLAPGATALCTATYVTSPADVTAGQVSDTATASGTPTPTGLPAQPLVTSNPSTVTVPVRQSPQVSLTKSIAPATVTAVGQTMTFSFLVTNTGNVAVTNLTITDTDFTGTGELGEIRCPKTTLAIGEQVTCAATYVTTQQDVLNGSLSNTATATVTGPDGSTAPSPPSSATAPAAPAPAVTLTKTVFPTTASTAGQTVTYSFKVTNTGNTTLSNFAISESTFSGSGTLSPMSCPQTTLAVGADMTCTASYQVTEQDIGVGQVTNTAQVTAVSPQGRQVTSSSSATLVTGALVIVKSVAPTAVNTVGATVTYSFKVTNNGRFPMTNVVVDDSSFTGTGQLGPITCPATTLAVGATMTCTATYTVTQTDIDNGSVANTAVASAILPDGEQVNAVPSKISLATSATPVGTLVKSMDPTFLDHVGQVVTYTFVMTNMGQTTMYNAHVVEDSFTGSGQLSPLSCDKPTPVTLLPTQKLTCTATYTVTQTDLDAGQISNSGHASWTNPKVGAGAGSGAGNTTGGSSPAVAAAPSGPSMTVTKTSSRASITAAGQAVTFTFVVKNTGNVTINNPTVTDTNFSGTGTLSPLNCPATPSLAPNATMTCTATYTTTQQDVDSGRLTNTANASGTTPDLKPVTAPASPISVPAPATPALTLVKTASQTAVGAAGQHITYTFKITNTGNVTLTNPQVTETTFTGAGVLGPVDCPASILAPGASMDCTADYEVTQQDLLNSPLTNTATVTATPPSAGTPKPVSPPSTATVFTGAGLTMEKTASRTTITAPGQVITYSFKVTNTGSGPVTNLVVNDNGFTGSGTLGPITCPVTTLAAGASTTCTATYTTTQQDVENVNAIRNTAFATGSTPSGPVGSPQSTVTVTPTRNPALTLTKSATPATGGSVGDVVTFSFLVTNTGNVTMRDIIITENAFSGTGQLGPITCPQTELVVGASTTCTAPYTLTQADYDAGQVTNKASATGIPPAGNAVTTPQSLAAVGMAAAPEISILKSVNPSTYQAGQTVTYLFTVTNTGNVALSNVNVTEDQFSGTGQMDAIVCPKTTLAVGESMTCQALYTATADDATAGTVTNTASSHGTPPPVNGTTPPPVDSTPSNATITFQAEPPSIEVVKTVDKPIYIVGEVLTYTLTVTNTGGRPLSNVTVTEDQFSGTGSLSGVQCPKSTLAVDESMVCTAVYTAATAEDVAAGTITNTVTAHGTPPAVNGQPATPVDSTPSNATSAAAPNFSLGDLFWLDNDGDGKYTPGVDTPVAGVPIEVIDADGNVVGTATTDADGRWVVTDLPPGTYHVHIPASAFGPGGALEDTVPVTNGGLPGDSGTNEDGGNKNLLIGDETQFGLDSQPVTLDYVRDANGAITGGNGPLNDDVGGLLPDEPDSFTNLTVDLAVKPAPTFSLGDLFWLDKDGDGKYTPGVDTPVAGVPIQVIDADGNVVATTTTDADGRWVVTDLPPGTYHVHIPGSAFAPDGPLAGTVPVTDGGLPGDSGTNEDGGNKNLLIGDETQFGLDSQPVTLDYVRDENGGVIGGNGPLNDDVAGLLPDEPDSFTNLTVDLAVELAPTFSLGDRVWLDKDGDGKYTPGVDTPVAGVPIQVIDADGNVVGTATTDADGRWVVTDLPPGTYHALIPPSAFAPGGPLAGTVPVPVGGETPGSDVNENGGNNNLPSGDPTVVGLPSTPVTLDYVRDENGAIIGGNGPLNDDVGGVLPDEPDSFTNLTVDLALQPAPTFSIGDVVWLDKDGDGKYTPGVDTPVAGVPIEVYDDEGNLVGTATTDANGRWVVTDLPPGTYHAHIPGSAFGPGGPLSGLAPSDEGQLPGSSNVNEDGGNKNVSLGDPTVNGLDSQPVTLGYVLDEAGNIIGGNAPTGDDVGGLLPGEDDSFTNLTLDLSLETIVTPPTSTTAPTVTSTPAPTTTSPAVPGTTTTTPVPQAGTSGPTDGPLAATGSPVRILFGAAMLLLAAGLLLLAIRRRRPRGESPYPPGDGR